MLFYEKAVQKGSHIPLWRAAWHVLERKPNGCNFNDFGIQAVIKVASSNMQAFSDCLWRGYSILMYCDLLTKSWFSNQ